MLAMTATYMVIELVVGNITNSMALVADSFHMLSDVIALVIAYVSVTVSPKEWKQNTFGWARAEVIFFCQIYLEEFLCLVINAISTIFTYIIKLLQILEYCCIWWEKVADCGKLLHILGNYCR